MNPFYSRLEEASLKAAFFPVELCPLYWKGEAKENKPMDIFDIQGYNLCPNHYAVVNMINGNVFACVTKNYALITNRQAYEVIGIHVACKVFGFQESIKFEANNVYMSKTKGECIIDYSRYIEKNQPGINDGWQAFIRMENSYNKTRKLSYTLGFMNLKEGAILSFNSLSISVDSAHTGALSTIIGNIDRQMYKKQSYKICEIEEHFQRKLQILRTLPVAKEDIFPLFCKIFNISKPQRDIDKDDQAALLLCCQFIETKAEEMVKKYGKNAYSLLLVFAGYANETNMASLYLYYDKAQASLGSWVDEYIEKAKEQDFSINQYIGQKAADTASWIRSL